MVILSVTLLSILAFFLRIKPRLSQKDFGIDSWYFLFCAEELKKDRRIPLKLPYFLLDISEQWYPPVLPIILSFFPRKFLEKYNWGISAFIDTIQMMVLYAVSYFLTKSLFFAVLASLLYAASPILVTQNSNLNSRALGALFLTLMMLAIYAYVLSSSIPNLILVFLFGATLLLTHKLATQQAVFILIGFSIIYLNPVYIFILAGIYFCAIILSGGFYLKVLKGHIEILRFWKKNLLNLYAHPIYKSPIYFNEEKAYKMKCCGGIASSRLWFNMAKLQFILILMAISFYFFIHRVKFIFADSFFLSWFFINILCILIITYFTPAKFLGEGQRYFTYGVFPVSFLLARTIFLNNLVYVFLLLCIFAINLPLIFRIHNEQKKNILAAPDNDLIELLKYIKELPRDNIACFPAHYCERIAYFCKKKTLWGGHSYGYDKLEPFLPVLLKPLEYFIETYNISYCLLNEKYVSIEDLNLSVKYKVIKALHQYKLIEFVEHG